MYNHGLCSQHGDELMMMVTTDTQTKFLFRNNNSKAINKSFL